MTIPVTIPTFEDTHRIPGWYRVPFRLPALTWYQVGEYQIGADRNYCCFADP